MCLIVYKPQGYKFDRAIINNAMVFNSDGWGLMWVQNGKIKTLKNTDMSKLYTALDKLEEAQLSISLHLRMATHGPIIKDNCHPFTSPCKQFAMMHNGVVSYAKMIGTESDTRAFCRETAWPALTQYFSYDDGIDAIEAADRSGSRLIFLNSNGQFRITGQWCDRDGLKYSNSQSFVSYRSIGTRFRVTDPYDLTEMADMSSRDILSLCRNDPDYVAALISEYFGSFEPEDYTDEPQYCDEPIDVEAF